TAREGDVADIGCRDQVPALVHDEIGELRLWRRLRAGGALPPPESAGRQEGDGHQDGRTPHRPQRATPAHTRPSRAADSLARRDSRTIPIVQRSVQRAYFSQLLSAATTSTRHAQPPR